MQRTRPIAAIVLVLAAVALGPGCRSTPTDHRASRLIDAEAVAQACNARTSRVTSLWARASVVLEGKDAEGRTLRERAEGHLQVIPPNQVALTLGKLGETNLYFGSNDLMYWWFDMTDSENKSAVFGQHDRVTPDKIDRLGLPIHPLDLVETLGITPLPIEPGQMVARPGPNAGEIIIAAPTRRGVRRFTVDDQRYEPSRVELIGPGGRVLLDVELSRYRLMAGLEPGEEPLRVPERVRVRMAGFDGEIRLSLHEPARREIRAIAFDPARLIGVYNIWNLTDLDDPGPVDGTDEFEHEEPGDER